MTIEEMKRIKKEKGYSYIQIAHMSGVPLGTVQKIFGGETKSPRYDTILALESLFRGETSAVREEMAVYGAVKKQGEYTTEDYYALPEDKRAELIDGVFYDMSVPDFVHQRIVGELYHQISQFIHENKGECIPLIAPLDVRLDSDDKTMVQPDVAILCDKNKIRKWGIDGAPDFIIEVLSPSTRSKDSIKKLGKYLDAGVREYWMIDPDKRKVIVYDFEHEDYPAIYGLEEKIPARMYEGRLQIDVNMIREMIREYPDSNNGDTVRIY